MVNNKKIIITESDREYIRSLYSTNKNNEYVFDFVLTENNKYLIIMDQVFVAGNGGKTIGSIWENTHIFNELISESISKMNQLSESVSDNIIHSISEFKWTKEIVKEWLNNRETISEGVLDWIKDKTKLVGDTLKKAARWAFNNVIDMLRWIRRNIHTNIGMVIDIVVSILAVKSNVVIWLLIVLLDIYEIGTGNFDPKDPERSQNPNLYLIGDLISVILTAAAGKVFRKSINVMMKSGVNPTSQIGKWLKTLSTRIPQLKNQLVQTANFLESKIKTNGIVGKMIGLIDKVLGNVVNFINKLFTREGLKAVNTGVKTTAAVSFVKNNFLNNKNSTIGDENSEIVGDAIKMGYIN